MSQSQVEKIGSPQRRTFPPAVELEVPEAWVGNRWEAGVGQTGVKHRSLSDRRHSGRTAEGKVGAFVETVAHAPPLPRFLPTLPLPTQSNLETN